MDLDAFFQDLYQIDSDELITDFCRKKYFAWNPACVFIK